MRQLRELRGKAVDFHTAVPLLDAASGKHESRLVPCRVVFRTLDERLHPALPASRRSPTTAPARAKAEGLGIALIARIETDDPTSLIGLPLIALTEMLARAGLPRRFDPLLHPHAARRHAARGAARAGDHGDSLRWATSWSRTPRARARSSARSACRCAS